MSAVIITDGDIERLKGLPSQSVEALIFIYEKLTPARVKELTPIAGSKLVLGGTAILAKSLAEAFEKL